MSDSPILDRVEASLDPVSQRARENICEALWLFFPRDANAYDPIPADMTKAAATDKTNDRLALMIVEMLHRRHIGFVKQSFIHATAEDYAAELSPETKAMSVTTSWGRDEVEKSLISAATQSLISAAT